MIIWLWIGFIVFVLSMLALDLGVFNRKAHVIRTPEALRWTAVCVVIALLFNAAVYFLYKNNVLGLGKDADHPLSAADAALQFFTGYVIEQSLSLDNIFVIAMIFAYFRVPLMHQHRVLFWGILGALVMRGGMIAAGTALIDRFHWIIYVFGGLLLFTAVKMLRAGEDDVDPERNIFVRIARRVFPMTAGFRGQAFFVREGATRMMTPMFLVLLVVESTDVLFAIDSIPAVFAITQDPFLVFTSNVFAILCLRSLYFALAGMLDKFRYLKGSLVFVLAFVGIKMILTDVYHIPTGLSLAVVGGILLVGVISSLMASRRDEARLGDFASTDASMSDEPGGGDGRKPPSPGSQDSEDAQSRAAR